MEQEIRTIESGRKFILLLLCYYAIPVIQSALAVVNGIPGVSYHWQRILNANADVIKVVFCLCTVLVLIMLIMIKEYNIDKRYKTGLLLMMANPIWATLKAFSPDTLSTGLPYQLAGISATIITIVGVFIFINASPVDRKVNIFVKCSPFIPSILYFLIGFLLVKVPMQYYNLTSSAGLFAIHLAVFITFFTLCRQRSY